ncbi:hypothetical protein SADUNF_Sadunf17G0021500 [Salix dunnii]|uniref:Ubiquitin-like domain-containing protein n=1 Tax=Salix dunnii TaxID=1413687 RepID=A0A835MEB0_9ROSI|nr:hypothetical protein SADUNF_Sadunf17G0021500 [Salix dunnii]
MNYHPVNSELPATPYPIVTYCSLLQILHIEGSKLRALKRPLDMDWKDLVFTMKVVVEILTGTLFYIEVGNDATVADLKKEIGAQQKLPQDRLILFLDNKQTRLISEEGDGATLVDCGVRDGSHIYLFFDPVDLDESSDHSWPQYSNLEQASFSNRSPKGEGI